MTDSAKPDRLARILVLLLALTGLLRVVVIFLTIRHDPSFRIDGSHVDYYLVIAPLLDHLPLAGLATVCAIGLLRGSAFATWMPFWIGLFSVVSLSDGGLIQWEPWSALAACPLTLAGMAHIGRARQSSALVSSAAGGVMVALVSPMVVGQLKVFTSTSDTTFMGGLASLAMLIAHRFERGWLVCCSVSVLCMMYVCIIAVSSIGVTRLDWLPLPSSLNMGDMALFMVGCLGLFVATKSSRTSFVDPVAPRLGVVLAAYMIPVGIVYALVPRYYPYAGSPALMCGRGDGGVIVHWSASRLLQFELGLDWPNLESRGKSLSWELSPNGSLERTALVPFVSKPWQPRFADSSSSLADMEVALGCDEGENIVFPDPGSGSRLRVKLGDVVVEGEDRLERGAEFVGRVYPTPPAFGWPRFVPLPMLIDDDSYDVPIADRLRREIGAWAFLGGRPVLHGCDQRWCAVETTQGIVLVDGSSGERIVTVAQLGHRSVVVGGGTAWFKCADRHVCYVTYEDPTRVHGIDTDDVPEVIDHRGNSRRTVPAPASTEAESSHVATPVGDGP